VPHPGAGSLYVKLRDDPSVINLATLAARQLPVSSVELERSVSRQTALVEDAPGAAAKPPPNTPHNSQ
jgi:hypothetical protein